MDSTTKKNRFFDDVVHYTDTVVLNNVIPDEISAIALKLETSALDLHLEHGCQRFLSLKSLNNM